MAIKKGKPVPEGFGKKKGEKKVMTPEEKKAKKAARMEAIKARPAGQRPNSKQVDVISLGDGGSIENFAYSVRKTGVVLTSVAKDAEGNVISTSVTFIPGCKAKSKKGHGIIAPGVAGEGKKGDDEDIEDVEEEVQEEAPEEDAPEKTKKKKSKKED